MAEEEIKDENAELSLHSAGEILRRAREQKDMSLEEVGKTTRIPQRHLMSIESGDYGALPGRTYAIGFAKSYARAVGVSETSISSQLREEMDEQGHGAYRPEQNGYSPTNPTSIPPKMLAWTAAGIGALLLVGYLVWRTLFLSPTDLTLSSASDPGDQTTVPESAVTQDPAAVAPSPSQSGSVVLTATERVWLKIYDADGERLFENEMTPGDKYNVPADANEPQILTGRPDALTVTIDGQVVQPLGTAERTIKDVGISATALLARGEADAIDNSDENSANN